MAILPTMQSFSYYPLYSALELAQILVYSAALILLFRKASGDWFAGQSGRSRGAMEDGPSG